MPSLASSMRGSGAIQAIPAKEKKRLPELAGLYKLLSNTTRLKTLLSLAEGDLCVCDIANVRVFCGNYSRPPEPAGFAALVIAAVWGFRVKKRVRTQKCNG